MKLKKSVLVSIIVIILSISGCTASQPIENNSQKSLADEAQHPEIMIEAEVHSINTSNRAINERFDTTYPSYFHIVTAQIHNLTVKNPDDVWLPDKLERNENITLLFERSTQPAEVKYISEHQKDTTANKTSKQSIDNVTVTSSLQGSEEIKSVSRTGNRWVFVISNSSGKTNQTRVLPGVSNGDMFQAELEYGQPLSVIEYELSAGK